MSDASPAPGLNARAMPPRGFYLASEVGQLAGAPGQQIGQWKRRGYIQASQSAVGYPNVYAYQDVAEAMVVHDLIDHDVPLRLIKTLITLLRKDRGHDWPLQAERLFVPEETDRWGRREVLVGVGEDRLDATGPTPWHYVMTPGNLVLIAEQLHRGGWAVRQLPDLQHIEVDPDKLSGRPSIRGLRIAAEDVAQIASESGSRVLIADYGLKPAQIDDAMAWWETVSAFEHAA